MKAATKDKKKIEAADKVITDLKKQKKTAEDANTRINK